MGIFEKNKNSDKKYKLVSTNDQSLPKDLDIINVGEFYRIEALRDIPEHGVKKGDLGGRVSIATKLSHNGSCWIGYEAEVFGEVSIEDNAYIGDKASVQGFGNRFRIRDNVRITGNAVVKSGFRNFPVSITIHHTNITDNVHIYGNAFLHNVRTISGDVKIYDNVKIFGAKEIYDTTEIFGDAYIGIATNIIGHSRIHGNARIEDNAIIRDSDISGNIIIPKYESIGRMVLNDQKQIEKGAVKEIEATPEKSRLLKFHADIVNRITSYETDIVKVIKYPTMTDRSVPSTLQMAIALTAVERLIKEEGCDDAELADALQELEAKFLIAESNALKVASSALSESELKKVEKAKDLMEIASNEASSENEKKQSFKQAFKQLEGVIVVPEIAVDTFRVKIGLKELEL